MSYRSTPFAEFFPSRLEALVKKTEGFAAVVNPYRVPSLHGWFYDMGLEWYFLYERTPPEELMDLIPRFIPLGEAEIPGDILELLLEKESLFFAGVGKGASVLDIAAALLPLHNVLLPAGENGWFRYYEPFVFHHFLQRLENRQASLLGGRFGITFYLPDTLEETVYEHTVVSSKSSRTSGPLSITSGQYEAILEAQYSHFINRTALELADRLPGMVRSEAAGLRPYVKESFEFAERNGIDKYDTMRRFVLLGASLGLYWYKAPEAVGILSATSSQYEKLDRICSGRDLA